jgi:hypothetical protein
MEDVGGIVGLARHGGCQLGCGVQVEAAWHGGRRAAVAFEWCLSLFHVDSQCLSNGRVRRDLGRRYGNKHVPRLARYSSIIRRIYRAYIHQFPLPSSV